MRHLEINVKDDRKIVEVWLTSAEKSDETVQQSLSHLYAEYKAKKYLVAVYQSGSRPLVEATSDLLCYNRKRIAAQEVAMQRQQLSM